MAAISCVSTFVVISFVFLNFVPLVTCWDNDDLELFDLVEDVNQNFYELFGIDQGATTSEVRKAYRKLSLVHHPDKSDAENAEEKFRQVVAVYEVLKDATKREKYNRVLVEGLPDWRQPIFYYRRARKMGLWELAIVLFIISIIGQYCVGWAMYIEKHLVLEDMMSSKRKKKGKKSKSDDNSLDEAYIIPTPKVLELWPFTLTVFTVKTIYNLPTTMKEWKEEKRLREEEEERQKILEEKLRQEQLVLEEELVRKPKKKTPIELPEYSKEMYSKFSAPTEGSKNISDSGLAAELEKAAMIQDRFGEEWTDEELVLLAKAAKKYPGGTTDRWEKIAEMVGRSVTEVTNKSKESKGGLYIKPNTNIQNATNTKSNVKICDEIITQNQELDEVDDDEIDYDHIKVRKRKNKQAKSENRIDGGASISQSQEKENIKTAVPATDSDTGSKPEGGNDGTKVAADGWTQNQQTIFEWALKQYPKGTDKRWDMVAEHIPGKSKEDCVARFKELAELISKKKKIDLLSKSKKSS